MIFGVLRIREISCVVGPLLASAYLLAQRFCYLLKPACSGYRLDGSGFESRYGKDMFVFSETSKPALRPSQSPIEWVPGARRSGREVNTHPT
jgi:hypothetical protein